MNASASLQQKQIGDVIAFTTDYSPSGARNLCGTVEARDWIGERVAYYTVRTLSGARFNVNANTLEGGRPF